jgi:hypothetical protein
MPDESGRKCGGEIKKYSLCAQCRHVTRKICIECGWLTLDQVHQDCFYPIVDDQFTMSDAIA